MEENLSLNDEKRRLINENFIKLFELFDIKHMSSGDDEYYILHTGLPDALFNSILLPELHTYDTEITNKINEPFIKEKIAFSWWFEEGSIAPKLLQNFEKNDYIFFGDVTGYILSLENYTPPETANPDFQIELIADDPSFKKWVTTLASNFALTKEAENMLFNRLSPYLGTCDVFIPIGAYIHGELIGTAAIFFTEGIGGFYYDSTMEKYRDQGICSALYHYRLQLLRTLHVHKAVVQTYPMATHIARDIGFEKINNYKVYFHSPVH